MKKTITLIFCLLTAIIVQAQTEHLNFMGIPLNGTITQFQTKLMAKGAKPDAKMNKELSAGCRMFKGEQDGYPNFLMYLKSDKGSSLGTVGLYISKSGYSFIEDVGVHVDYIDFYNNRKNEEKEMDDL